MGRRGVEELLAGLPDDLGRAAWGGVGGGGGAGRKVSGGGGGGGSSAGYVSKETERSPDSCHIT